MGFKHIYVRVSCKQSKPIWSQIDWNRFVVLCEVIDNLIVGELECPVAC